MATIKLQPSGKVVIKDGKVACTCCAQPGCCPYPSQALVDGLYTYQDLPDTVLGTGIFGDDNVVMSRLNPPQPSIDSSGTSYYRGFSLDGSLVGIGLRDGLEWVGTEVANEDAEFGECLISRLPPSTGGLPVDQFADSYTATDPSGDSITLTRESLCVWIGPEPDFYQLQYFDDSASEPVRCKWFFIDSLKDEGQFQNTPTGNYTQPLDENPWIIS
jgi:hypothetical protein